jgi:hypothetical protein
MIGRAIFKLLSYVSAIAENKIGGVECPAINYRDVLFCREAAH